ncbi:hypothetical protein R3P38DRAFT_654888 [Favolaschia claudopus]|uniref:Uncharacterized protein n=1 Tax=Favolaschia claudopus TaxID=2862362 RepID=A0AAW0E753_9AGAR
MLRTCSGPSREKFWQLLSSIQLAQAFARSHLPVISEPQQPLPRYFSPPSSAPSPTSNERSFILNAYSKSYLQQFIPMAMLATSLSTKLFPSVPAKWPCDLAYLDPVASWLGAYMPSFIPRVVNHPPCTVPLHYHHLSRHPAAYPQLYCPRHCHPRTTAFPRRLTISFELSQSAHSGPPILQRPPTIVCFYFGQSYISVLSPHDKKSPSSLVRYRSPMNNVLSRTNSLVRPFLIRAASISVHLAPTRQHIALMHPCLSQYTGTKMPAKIRLNAASSLT